MKRSDRKAAFNNFKSHYYAHRGLFDNNSGAPENTIPAFKRAVDDGFGVEMDVQLTKDKRVVIAHDYSLKRICGEDKLIKDLSYLELRGYKILNSGEAIPLFSDALQIIDGKVPVIVEIKAEEDFKDTCELTSGILSSYRGLYCVESFSPYVVGWYKKKCPDVIRGQLSDDYLFFNYLKSKFKNWALTNMIYNAAYKPDFIAYNYQFKDKKCLSFWKKILKCGTAAWTIKSQEELDAASEMFDIIIFDSFTPIKKPGYFKQPYFTKPLDFK